MCAADDRVSSRVDPLWGSKPARAGMELRDTLRPFRIARTEGEQDVTIFRLRRVSVDFALDVRRDGADDGPTPVHPQNRKLNTAPDRRQLVLERLRPDQHDPPVGLNLERFWAFPGTPR